MIKGVRNHNAKDYNSMFIIYDVNTTVERKRHPKEKVAKALVTRWNKKDRGQPGEPGRYAYASQRFYVENVVHMVERRSAYNGHKFMEPSNTPYYLSPSSETYWSS